MYKGLLTFHIVEGWTHSLLINGIWADFFVLMVEKSERPKSALDVSSAALSCYYAAIDHPSPIDADVRKLINGLVKSGTTQLMQKSLVMPRKPFIDLFKSWPENRELGLEYLRLKTLTLLALVLMLRPSDVARGR